MGIGRFIYSFVDVVVDDDGDAVVSVASAASSLYSVCCRFLIDTVSLIASSLPSILSLTPGADASHRRLAYFARLGWQLSSSSNRHRIPSRLLLCTATFCCILFAHQKLRLDSDSVSRVSRCQVHVYGQSSTIDPQSASLSVVDLQYNRGRGELMIRRSCQLSCLTIDLDS